LNYTRSFFRFAQ